MSNNTTPQKTCTKCNQTFPATKEYFHRNKNSKYGLSPKCKACVAEYQRQYREENKEMLAEYQKQWAHENREQRADYNRQWREENPDYRRKYYEENRERELEQHRQWREENPDYKRQWHENNREQQLEQMRQWHENNPDYRRWWRENNRDYHRQWREANPDKVRVKTQRYRARKQSLPATFTAEQWDYCLAYFNYTCPVCDNQLRDLFGNVEPHADHWIPISYEGDDNPGTVANNMVCLCNSCNLSKNNKLPDVWLKDTYGTRKANEILARIEAYFSSLI